MWLQYFGLPNIDDVTNANNSASVIVATSSRVSTTTIIFGVGIIGSFVAADNREQLHATPPSQRRIQPAGG